MIDLDEQLGELETKKRNTEDLEEKKFYYILQDVATFLDLASSSFSETLKKSISFNKFLEKAFVKLITQLVEEYKILHMDTMEFSEKDSEEFTIRIEIKTTKTLRIDIHVGLDECNIKSYEVKENENDS